MLKGLVYVVNVWARFSKVLRHRLFEIITVGAASITILASLFDWFQLSDNIYRNIALALAALLLTTQFGILRSAIDAENARQTLTAELNHFQSLMRGFGFEVAARDIPATMTQALIGATRWSFSGGTGSWQRAAVLPHLALIRDRAVPYHIQLVDPRDDALCSAYAEYRNRSGRQTGTTSHDVQMEVFAFIYAVCVYTSSSRLEPIVSLLQDYSSLRFDIGDEDLFVTAASALEPCLRFPRNHWMYQYVVDQIEQGARVLPKLDIREAVRAMEKHGPAASPGKILPLVRVVVADVASALPLKMFGDPEWTEIEKRSKYGKHSN